MTYERHSHRSHSLPNLGSSDPSRPPIPAVIRPLQPSASEEPTSRVDASQTLRGPHRRVEKLEEYVSWLQQQTHKELNRQAGAIETLTRRTVVQDPPFRQPSTSSNTGIPSPHSAPSPQSKPIIQFVETASTRPIERADDPHLQGASALPPRPKTPIHQFQPEADLRRVIEKLETAQVRVPGKPQAQEPVDEPAFYRPATERPEPVEPFASQAPPRRTVTPAEFAQPYCERDTVSRSTDDNIDLAPSLTKKEIIQTISSAIATVLTNQADPIIEAKIRQQLKDLQLEFVEDSHNGPSSSPSTSKPQYGNALSSSQPESTTQYQPDAANLPPSRQPSAPISPPISSPLSAPSSVPTPLIKEIPTYVAAWDVPDFRWPMISEQMITHGADAISTLTSTVLKTLRGTRRRVAVTSPDRSAGTTSIAIGLARWAALEGQRVLLIDGNIGHPELSTLVGLGPGISWLNGIDGRDGELTHPAELIVRSQKLPLCVLPLFPTVSRDHMPELLFDYLGKLIDPVTFEFDLVVLDLGPSRQIVDELSDGQTLIDTALIVHQDRTVRTSQTQNQLRALNVEQFVFAQNSIHPNVKSHVA